MIALSCLHDSLAGILCAFGRTWKRKDASSSERALAFCSSAVMNSGKVMKPSPFLSASRNMRSRRFLVMPPLYFSSNLATILLWMSAIVTPDIAPEATVQTSTRTRQKVRRRQPSSEVERPQLGGAQLGGRGIHAGCMTVYIVWVSMPWLRGGRFAVKVESLSFVTAG